MKTILIVGQVHSGYTSVFELLSAAGMQAAKASRRERFMPNELTNTLCQMEGLDLASDNIQQAQSGKLWQELALDLLLGNVEQPLWGWADPSTIFFLDYWKNADPNIVFLLVYGAPESALAASLQDVAPATAQQVTQQAQNWQAYNSALLHFYHRNPDRCLLVHAERTTSDPHLVVECVNDHFGLDLNLNIETQTSWVSNRAFDLPSTIAKALVENQPAMTSLYEELQSVADLAGLADNENRLTSIKLWNAFNELSREREVWSRNSATLSKLSKFSEESQLQIEQQKQALDTQMEENTLLLQQLHQVQEELERYYLENQEQKRWIAKLRDEQKTQTKQAKTNEHLLLQPQQIQKGFESYQLNNQEPKMPFSSDRAQAKFGSDKGSKPHYGAANRIKRQLTYRLGATMINQSRTFMGWLGMPFALYKTVGDFKQDKLARGNEMLPPITKYRDAHEAERVKQHLSYRLGTIMIANSKGLVGWLKMPWLLTSEVRDFKQAKDK